MAGGGCYSLVDLMECAERAKYYAAQPPEVDDSEDYYRQKLTQDNQEAV